ncbi:MAG: Mov34/MPN/PAD-1 family protein [Candidatus Methanofastidiosia archaeon]
MKGFILIPFLLLFIFPSNLHAQDSLSIIDIDLEDSVERGSESELIMVLKNSGTNEISDLKVRVSMLPENEIWGVVNPLEQLEPKLQPSSEIEISFKIKVLKEAKLGKKKIKIEITYFELGVFFNLEPSVIDIEIVKPAENLLEDAKGSFSKGMQSFNEKNYLQAIQYFSSCKENYELSQYSSKDYTDCVLFLARSRLYYGLQLLNPSYLERTKEEVLKAKNLSNLFETKDFEPVSSLSERVLSGIESYENALNALGMGDLRKAKKLLNQANSSFSGIEDFENSELSRDIDTRLSELENRESKTRLLLIVSIGGALIIFTLAFLIILAFEKKRKDLKEEVTSHEIFEEEIPKDPALSLYISEDAFCKMIDHANRFAPERLEVLGFLIGERFSYEGREYTLVEDVVTGKLETTAFSVRFEREFSELFERLSELREDYMIVGWYHSHPGLTCFLSSTDVETQRTLFPKPYHYAIVIDPVIKDFRVFGLNENHYVEKSFAVFRVEDEVIP